MRLGTPTTVTQAVFDANKRNLSNESSQILNGSPGNYAGLNLYSDSQNSSVLYVEVLEANNGQLIIEPNSNNSALELDVDGLKVPGASSGYWQVTTDVNIATDSWDIDVTVAEKNRGGGTTSKGTWKFTKGRS